MLSGHAYSFRQKSRLAISLSWIAGYTNVITLIVSAQVISHMTGNTTWLGRFLVSSAGKDALHSLASFAFLILMFFLGAVVSAIMTERADRAGFSSRYIAPIASEAALLAAYSLALVIWRHRHGLPDATHPLSDFNTLPLWIVGLAALAMGLQNATITKISGAVVRTTHVTGVVTDLGLESVQLFLWWRDKTKFSRPERYARVLKISRRHPSTQRLLLLASIYGSFLFGSCAGTLVYYTLPDYCMLAPILFLLWIILVDYFRPIGFVRELDQMTDPELQLFGIVKTMLPPELGIYRLGHQRQDAMHHAPNFQFWLKRLPAHWRVVILVVSPLTRFNSESVADLRTAAQQMSATHRRLLLSGVNPTQFRLMEAAGLTNVIANNDFSPDLEFSIARALEVCRELSDEKHHPAPNAPVSP